MTNLLTYVHHVTEKLHVVWNAATAEEGNKHYLDGKPLWDQLSETDHTPLDSGASIRSANIAEGQNAVPEAVSEAAVEEVKKKRPRRTKLEMEADAARVIPITDSTPPVAIPVANAPAPSAVPAEPADPAVGLGIPGFLKVNTPPEPPSPPAVAKPPVLPSPPPFTPVSKLADRVVAEIRKRTAGQADTEQSWTEWLASFGIGTVKSPFGDVMTTVSFMLDDDPKLTEIAATLSVV